MTSKEILTEVNNKLPQEFDQLEPQLKLHHLLMGITKTLEENCGLTGEWILVDGNQTLLELLRK